MYYNNMVCICIFFKKKNQTREVLPESSIILLTAGRKSFSYRADLKHTHTHPPPSNGKCATSQAPLSREAEAAAAVSKLGELGFLTQRDTPLEFKPPCVSL